jgi:uncharacterized SAM-binding protein YcdF (DUF218 family)
VAEFLWFLFSAGGVVLTLALGVLWIMLQPRSARARRFLAGTALFFVLASTYGFSHQVSRLIGAGYEPLERTDVPKGPTAIVVLGSASFTALDWDDHAFSVPDERAAMRVLEAARVFRVLDANWVISSGGTTDPDDSDEPTGATMREALIRLGVPADRLLVETESRNTHDEAVIVAPLLRSLGADHVVLVTSRVHMRRSAGAFRAEGVAVIPAVARNRVRRSTWRLWLLPSEKGLDESAMGAHEVVGLVYYALRGWYRF